MDYRNTYVDIYVGLLLIGEGGWIIGNIHLRDIIMWVCY